MKCPNCNKNLVKIIYGFPDKEAIDKLEKKKVYLGGCEMLEKMENPKYHCYNCNRNYFKDLSDYIITESCNYTNGEIPNFLKR